jgi:hypothetical protein
LCRVAACLGTPWLVVAGRGRRLERAAGARDTDDAAAANLFASPPLLIPSAIMSSHEPSPAPEDVPPEGVFCTLRLIRKKDGSEISRYPVDGEVTSFGRSVALGASPLPSVASAARLREGSSQRSLAARGLTHDRLKADAKPPYSSLRSQR